MAKVELFDNVYFNYVGVDERTSEAVDSLNATINEVEFGSMPWTDSTKFLANFTNNIDGSNFEGGLGAGFDHYEVYKQIGESKMLHLVYSGVDTIIEDFVAGNLCNYKYFVYPVCKYGEKQLIKSPSEGSYVQHDMGGVTIMGLIPSEEDEGVYYVDYDQIWKFDLNLENNGTTLNIDKTFNDTQHRYPQVSGGNRQYKTAQVSGLIGRYNCKSNSYIDSYDLLEDWDDFASKASLKLLKDVRGRLMLCEIESSSFEYITAIGFPATVTFGVKEVESLENVAIMARELTYNPLTTMPLIESSGSVLSSTDGDYNYPLFTTES